jgi:DNA-binding response OmpR family regulator
MAKVLIVDDNHDAADTLSVLLGQWGYARAIAYDGPTALDIAADFSPDVVLLDLAMPGIDGFEVARRLQELSTAGRMHLVALSGYGSTEDKIQSYREGFECHLLKPVDLDTLKAVLERYCPKTEPETRTDFIRNVLHAYRMYLEAEALTKDRDRKEHNLAHAERTRETLNELLRTRSDLLKESDRRVIEAELFQLDERCNELRREVLQEALSLLYRPWS